MEQASLVFRRFCAQIQLAEVDSIIAIEREGAGFLLSQSLPYKRGCSGLGECLLGGHPQTIAVLSEAAFGTLGKHFRLRAGGGPRTDPLPSRVCAQGSQFSQKPQGKGLLGRWVGELDSVLVLELLFTPSLPSSEPGLSVASARGAFVERMDERHRSIEGAPGEDAPAEEGSRSHSSPHTRPEVDAVRLAPRGKMSFSGSALVFLLAPDFLVRL